MITSTGAKNVIVPYPTPSAVTASTEVLQPGSATFMDERRPSVGVVTPSDSVDSYISRGRKEHFPLEALPPLIQRIAAEAEKAYGVPPSLGALSAIACLSGAVGQSVYVRGARQDHVTKLNLYVIAVADRGTGKGTIGNRLAEPIIQRSKALNETHRKCVAGKAVELKILEKEIEKLTRDIVSQTSSLEKAQTLAALEAKSERATALKDETTRTVSLWVGDTTSEALGRALMDNGDTLFSYSAEAGSALQVALGKYSDSGDYNLLLSGYSGDAFKVTRINRPEVEIFPCLSLLWMIQPSLVRSLIVDANAVDRGLTARPLIFDSEAVRKHDDGVYYEYTQQEPWAELLNRVLDRRHDGVAQELPCRPDAREIFRLFYNETVDLEAGPFADIRGEASRWCENAVKVAGLFAVAEDAQTVTGPHAARAVAVVRWAGLNYFGILHGGRRERLKADLEKVLGLLGEHENRMSLTQCKSHGFDRSRVCVLATTFQAHLKMEKTTHDGPGRPVECLVRVTQ